MSRAKESHGAAAVRERILTAAFEAFRERGYAATSTLEIATRAHVSKRDLYALVGDKHKMLIPVGNLVVRTGANVKGTGYFSMPERIPYLPSSAREVTEHGPSVRASFTGLLGLSGRTEA